MLDMTRTLTTLVEQYGITEVIKALADVCDAKAYMVAAPPSNEPYAEISELLYQLANREVVHSS